MHEKKNESLISIIMPVYNAEQYISTAVESVINQSHKDWELLIINDGSIDDSEKKIIGFKDSRIRYFSQKNEGVSGARNVGLKNMVGDYFCFLDADDYMPPRSLEFRYNKFHAREELEFVDGMVKIYSKDLKTKINFWKPSFSGYPINQLLNLNSTCFFGLTWMIRNRANKSYRFRKNISHGEDLLFYIETAIDGGFYDFVDEVVLNYRKGHKSAMSDLIGLEKGYHQVYIFIKSLNKISLNQLAQFRKNARIIIFKSYLGNYQLKNAIISLIKKW